MVQKEEFRDQNKNYSLPVLNDSFQYFIDEDPID